VKKTKSSPLVAEHITRRFSVAGIATGIVIERYVIPGKNKLNLTVFFAYY